MRVGVAAVLSACAAWGCTEWTTVHGGYAEVIGDRKALYAVEMRRVHGGKIDSTSAVGGLRVDGNGEQLDVELHAGVERPLFLAERWMLIPSFTVDAVRVSRLESRWFVGTHSPALGLEWLYWFDVERRRYTDTGVLGCMGGAIGYDCPRSCEVEDVNRRGSGLRVEGSYDLRYSEAFPKYNDWSVWALLGFSEASSTRERDSCAVKD